MNASPEISVVVPVYRNADTLDELVARINATLGARSETFDIVFVDDACPEGSSTVLRSLADRHSHVHVSTHSTNRGQNQAVLTGLAAARGRIAVVLDADLQDLPEAIPALIDALTGGIDAVFGGRCGHYASTIRTWTSRAHKRVLHAASKRRIPIDAGLFVAMTRRMVERIVSGPHRDPYVIALMGRTGLAMTSIPVERAARLHGQSAYSTIDRARLAWRALVTTFTRGGRS